MALGCAGSLFAAVKPGTNLIANPQFESDQLEEPAFWMVTHGKPIYVWNASGGPNGIPSVRFDNNLVPSEKAPTLTQFGLQLWEKGRYRISGWVRADNLQCSRGGICVANMGWTKSDGFEFRKGTYGWERFEKEFDLFPSRGNTWIASFYIVKISGAVELADVKLEPVNDETCRNSSPSALAKAQDEARLVPVAPFLDEIPAANPRIAFRFFGKLPEGVSVADCDLVLTANGVCNKTALADGTMSVSLPKAAPARGTFEAAVVVRRTGERPFARTYCYDKVEPLKESGPQLKRLNNMVVQLVRTPVEKGADASASFTLAHGGWVYVSADASAVTLDGKAVVDSTTPRHETFRRLARGAHVVKAVRANGGELVVRRIPEILSYRPGNAYNIDVNPRYDWTYQERHVLHGLTTMNAGEIPEPVRESVRRRGYEWFGNVDSRDLGDDEEMAKRLRTSSRITASQWDGATCDEQYPSSPHIMSRYASGLWKYGRGIGKGAYTWIVGRPITQGVDHDLLASAVNAVCGRGMILNEIYLTTRATEQEAADYIRQRIAGGVAAYAQFYPNVNPRFGVIFGAFTQSPGISQAVHPDVDYRYYLDMQFRHMVTDPSLKDLGCTGYWGTYRADEGLHPWLFLLTRHYCVEGRTDLLSPKYGLTYSPGHLRDGDFMQGLSAWRASKGVTVGRAPAFSKASEGRWGSERGRGDEFAVLPQGGGVAQTAKGLTAGRSYALEFAAFDADDVIAGKVNPKLLGVEVTLGKGATADERRCWTHVDRRTEKEEPKAAKAPRINLVRRVFTATAPEVEITIANPATSAAARMGVNMVSLRPFFASYDGSADAVPVFGEPQYDPAKTPIANLLAIQRAVDGLAEDCILVAPVPRGLTKASPARQAWELSGHQVFRLADTNRIHFLDLNGFFLNRDGTLKTAFYEPDGLRLNAKGKAEYDSRLKPLVDWFSGPRTTPPPQTKVGYLSLNDGPRFQLRRDAKENFARWWWNRTVDKLAEADALRAAGGELDVLFVGDSLTHRWEYEDSGAPVLRKLADRYRVLNVAIGGDRWEQQLWMVKSGMIDGLKPRYVSVLLGANNHNYRWTKDSPERTRDGVKEIIDAVRKRCPNAQFILYPMLMRLSDDPNTQTNRANDIATCPLLRELAEKEGARWVEFDQEMSKAIGGTDELKRKYTTDFTHLSRYMFEKWYEALEPVLAPRVPNTMYDHAEPVNLPELLRTKDGRKITSVSDWEAHRGELLDFFTRNVYGERPVERPADLKFEPIGEDVELPGLPAVRKRVRISFSGPRGAWHFDACAFVPKTASAGRPAPAFLLICNRRLAKFADIDRTVKSGFFPVEDLVARGYAAVVFKNTDLALDEYPPYYREDGTAAIPDPDFADGFYACWAPKRTETSWGAISAWAWGASRVLDWLETTPGVDAGRVAVVGHSRGGKTSLWAAASDSRFAMACVNDSGCCGAKLNHVAVSQSETIQQDNNNNPHWFARSYRQFNGRDAWLPYDQHWIAALVAPRLLYIASASQDVGAGPWGEFLTARHATPAWELYGKKGLVEDHPYAIEKPFQEGSVGYHLRAGGHNLAQYDWDRYMDFADRHMKGSAK